MPTPLLGQRVADELEIMRLLAKLAQAGDDRDFNAYRECFADEVLHHPRGAPSGTPPSVTSSDAYARAAIDANSVMDWTHHRLCNFVINVEGDQARAKVDFVAEAQRSNDSGTPDHMVMGGRYDLTFARLPGGWRITARDAQQRYLIGDRKLLDLARGKS
jgi:3-phenylpropionate/cinnamic acid dioxygenase small subunit